MPDPITLRVIGVPAPQGSKSAIVNKKTGRAHLVEGKSTTGRNAVKEWRRAVADAARAHLTHTDAATVAGACAVDAAFVFTRPPSVSAKARPHHTVKPDVDKVARSTLDALVEGGLLDADQLVADLRASKRYAGPGEPPGAVITVHRLAGVPRG